MKPASRFILPVHLPWQVRPKSGSAFNLLGKKIPFLIDVDSDLTDIDSKTVNGEIKFLSANEYTIYWSWNIFSGKRYLGGESRNLFIKEDERTNEAVIEKVINHICKTRWGRKKIFSNFRWSDTIF